MSEVVIMPEEKKIKITYRHKNQISCPICKHAFNREELLTGRGRLIAGDLTEELRRTYQESKKYKKIYPLIYSVIVCPKCFFATIASDFNIPTKHTLDKLINNTPYRISKIEDFFPGINFNDNRTLQHGIASYMLALTSYSFFEKKYAPSLKRAICAIRTAWCIDDICETGEKDIQKIMANKLMVWDKDKLIFFRNLFYKKAAFFYKQAVETAQTGKEIAEGVRHYGPDVDKNFGYFGMLYMASLMNFRLEGFQRDRAVQITILENSKRILSKLFGSGKADREKPEIILSYAKDLFREINKKLKDIAEEGS